MLFNSLEYFFFLPVVFAVYWGLSKASWQNSFLLLASYFFYGLWDYRFLSLIILSSATDFLLGLLIHKQESLKMKKRLLIVSLIVNLGLLGLFKYYDFFVQSFIDFAALFGFDLNWGTLHVLLPVGISFYTFQTLSYTIDVYRGKINPTRNALNFFTYVAFFPQLVAGPIERASRLLPQIESRRKFDFERGKAGLKQILWGMFIKVVVADNCAVFVDQIFGNLDSMNGPMLILGLMLFGFQIYGDFAGYSEIARGTAKLFGIDLMRNFATPYFSRDIAEFWRRWHISLSTWFRDYLYYPLGGNRFGRLIHLRNVFIVFLVSGLWHGANWTFVFWGLAHVLMYVPLAFAGVNRRFLNETSEGRLFVTGGDLLRIVKTYFMVTLAWMFFRCESLEMVGDYMSGLFNMNPITVKWIDEIAMAKAGGFALIMMVVEWINRHYDFALERLPQNAILRYTIYLVLSLFIIQYFAGGGEFIYFQF